MNDKEIEKDIKSRVDLATKELAQLLKKHQLNLTAEDTIGERTAIKVAIRFVNTKEYPEADLAQPEPKITDKEILDVMEGKGDKI